MVVALVFGDPSAPGSKRVLRRDLRYLAGSKQDEKVEDHLEKVMENNEELRQVEKDYREMMDEFLSSAKEAKTLLDPGPDGCPKTEATTISKVKGMITSFQRYREVLQTKAALIKKLRWRAATFKAERDMVWLIQDFDLLGADCERLEKEAADRVAIGVAKAAAQNASVPPVIPATGGARSNDGGCFQIHSSSVHRDGGSRKHSSKNSGTGRENGP